MVSIMSDMEFTAEDFKNGLLLSDGTCDSLSRIANTKLALIKERWREFLRDAPTVFGEVGLSRTIQDVLWYIPKREGIKFSHSAKLVCIEELNKK